MSSAEARIFVDTSVILAILLQEPGYEALAERMGAAADRYTSPLALLEATMALSTAGRVAPVEAEAEIRQLLADFSIRLTTIDSRTASTAVLAFERYGKGRNPARLNLGDCISYACAKQLGLALLYKGDDFARTDLA